MFTTLLLKGKFENEKPSKTLKKTKIEDSVLKAKGCHLGERSLYLYR